MLKLIRNFIIVCVFLISGVLFFLALLPNLIADNTQQVKADTIQQSIGGYRAALYNATDNTFLAAGTGGRLDKISNEKLVEKIDVPTTEDLFGFGYDDDNLLIFGAGGTILHSNDGIKFSKVNTGTSMSIFGLTAFKGIFLACGQEGTLLISEDAKTWTRKRFAEKRDIIAIAATDDYVMAITSESDFYISLDGIRWSFQNFNTAYAGYYEPYIFKGLISKDNTFYVFGQLLENPDLPLLMRTVDGKSWTFTPLSTIDIGSDENVVARMNAAIWDSDQIVAVCDGGRIFTITDCITCHKLTKYTDVDLHGMALGSEKLLIVGDNFEFELLDAGAARQYNIKAEQAYKNFQNGALIVDVRTEEEYNKGHIAGAIHIPVDEISEKLSQVATDITTEIIFYCEKGSRSQTALETALTMGYKRLYNLGGFSDWPYETE